VPVAAAEWSLPSVGRAAGGLTVSLLFVPEPSWSGHQMSCSLVSDAVEA